MLDPDPHNILPECATILDYGIASRCAWGAVNFAGEGEHWAAVDLSTAYIVPYGKGLAVYYAFGGPHEELLADFWRFDVVVQLMGRCGLRADEVSYPADHHLRWSKDGVVWLFEVRGKNTAEDSPPGGYYIRDVETGQVVVLIFGIPDDDFPTG